jgi:hypothetical protein
MKKECKLSIMKTMFVLLFTLVAGAPLLARDVTIVIRDTARESIPVEQMRLAPDSLIAPRWIQPWKGYRIGIFSFASPGTTVKVGFAGKRYKNWTHWEGTFVGFTKFLDKEWKDYKGAIELDWANSFTLQFNMQEMIIASNYSGNSLLFTGIGLDYHRLYFDRDSTLQRQADGSIAPVSLASLGVTDPRRSVFKALYLTVPLLFEQQFAKHRGFISGGLVGGIRLHSKTKIVYDDGGKRKLKRSGSYGMDPFKVEATVRVGYGPISVWASKSLMPMFNPDKSPRVYPFTVGIGINGNLTTRYSGSKTKWSVP